MSISPDKKWMAAFGTALLAARTAAKVSRAELANDLEVLPRTIGRWEAGENIPDETRRSLVLHFFEETGSLPRPLLEKLAEASMIDLWTVGLAPPPRTPFVPTPAHQKAIDDAIREAAEELEIAPRKLRPVASALFTALAKSGVPANVAAEMAVARGKKG